MDYKSIASIMLTVLIIAISFLIIGGFAIFKIKNKSIKKSWMFTLGLTPLIWTIYVFFKECCNLGIYNFECLSAMNNEDIVTCIMTLFSKTVPVFVNLYISVRVVKFIIKYHDKKHSNKKYDDRANKRPENARRTPLTQDEQNQVKQNIKERLNKIDNKLTVQQQVQRPAKEPQIAVYEKSKEQQKVVESNDKPVQKIQSQILNIKKPGARIKCEFCGAANAADATHCCNCWAPIFKM